MAHPCGGRYKQQIWKHFEFFLGSLNWSTPGSNSLESLWKSLIFLSISRPGKSLKTSQVLESPWILSLKSLEVPWILINVMAVELTVMHCAIGDMTSYCPADSIHQLALILWLGNFLKTYWLWFYTCMLLLLFYFSVCQVLAVSQTS